MAHDICYPRRYNWAACCKIALEGPFARTVSGLVSGHPAVGISELEVDPNAEVGERREGYPNSALRSARVTERSGSKGRQRAL